MRGNTQDIVAGGFFVVIGGWFGVNAWLNLSIGTASRMGAGYFPIILGSLLTLLGLTIAIRSVNDPSSPIKGIAWRGVVLIGLAPVVFGMTVKGLGLLGAVMLSIFVASFSSVRVDLKTAILISLSITAFCIVVFYYGLGLPFDLFGPWLAFSGN